MDQNKLQKILKGMGILDHLTCFLRNLNAGQETTFRNEHETMDWFSIEKSVHQSLILSLCLFKLYAAAAAAAVYIKQNAGLDEAQAEIKISRRNINNLREADDITLTVESEKELRRLLMKVKEEREKAGLKLNSQNIQIMASDPIPSWQIHGIAMEKVRDIFVVVGIQNHCKWWLQP